MTLKEKIKEELLKVANENLDQASKAYESTRELTTSNEMKQEGKYDTRAIESGQLAGAQKVRVEELKLEVQMIEELPVRDLDSDDEVRIGALFKMKLNDKVQNYFLSTTAGGSLLNIDGEVIMVISVFSPIGDAALGLKLGDDFELETPKGVREYEILSLS